MPLWVQRTSLPDRQPHRQVSKASSRKLLGREGGKLFVCRRTKVFRFQLQSTCRVFEVVGTRLFAVSSVKWTDRRFESNLNQVLSLIPVASVDLEWLPAVGFPRRSAAISTPIQLCATSFQQSVERAQEEQRWHSFSWVGREYYNPPNLRLRNSIAICQHKCRDSKLFVHKTGGKVANRKRSRTSNDKRSGHILIRRAEHHRVSCKQSGWLNGKALLWHWKSRKFADGNLRILFNRSLRSCRKNFHQVPKLLVSKQSR